MKRILTLLLYLFICHSINAQTDPPTDAFVYFTTNASSTEGFFKVILPSASSVASIKVRLGTMEGDYSLVDHEFVYDVTTGLPAGFSYVRNNLECILGVGTFIEPSTCFGEVLLKSTTGVWSDPIRFVSN